MDSFDIPIQIRCSKCNEKLIAEGEILTDDSIVSCPSCGAKVGTFAEVKKHAGEYGAELIRKRLEDHFGKS